MGHGKVIVTIFNEAKNPMVIVRNASMRAPAMAPDDMQKSIAPPCSLACTRG